MNTYVIERQIPDAGKLKAEGTKSGVPDICLPVARGAFIGCYIEMKADSKKKTSETQDWWLSKLAIAGHFAIRCNSADEAIHALENYLNLK